jgi:hypothetical protein
MQFIQVSIASLITFLMTLAGIHIAEAGERRVELEINGALAFGRPGSASGKHRSLIWQRVLGSGP